MKCLYALLVLLLSFGLFSSCTKLENGWDDQLNGRWVEVASQNAKSLPAGCEIVFDRSYMSICDEAIGSDLNSKSGINSGNGQIWINYRLSGQRHIEYRYDYAFEGDYLWMIEEETSTQTSPIGSSLAKKYRRK